MSKLKISGISIPLEKRRISQVLKTVNVNAELFPLIVSNRKKHMVGIAPTPMHGRSVVVSHDRQSQRYIAIKGCGLTYSPYTFVSTGEFNDHVWGATKKQAALREYVAGRFISDLGIRTNQMQAVFELEESEMITMQGKRRIRPTIVQYSVESPYRIGDIPFLDRKQVMNCIDRWSSYKVDYPTTAHLVAAEILFGAIRQMHSSNVLHNAIDQHNLTLALELLDFEMSSTPNMPYPRKDQRDVARLMPREVMHAFEIVSFIAFYLREKTNDKKLLQLMEKNGFESSVPRSWQKGRTACID